MANTSLRLKIIFFFCLLGLLPQVIISYVSVDAYTQSLEEVHESRISQLVDQAAEQTTAKANNLITDLINQASQSYLQLIFQQYAKATSLSLLRERLESFRIAEKVFSHLHVCHLDGKRLAGTNGNGDTTAYALFERQVISGNRGHLQKPYRQLYLPTNELAFFLPVHSFRQSTRVVGILVAYLPVEVLTQYLKKIDVGQYAVKSILTEDGETVQLFKDQDDFRKLSTLRSYSAAVTPLGWEITVRIHEEDLFRDVVLLKTKNALFIVASILLAFGAWFIFSHRFTQPFKEIMEGSQIFATGNLDHRITVSSGYEAKLLAKAFNTMASDLKRRQVELNQSARLASLGVMTAGLAHEIKNPLAGIKTSAQVIGKILATANERPPETSSLSEDDCLLIAELMQGVSDEIDRLAKLLNDMLQFGRPHKPMPQLFDLAEIVSRAIRLVWPGHANREIQLSNGVEPHEVFADADQILQVVLNLLNNGLESVTDHTGRVELHTELTEGDILLLKILDNGKGIPEDRIQRIFDPFFSLREGGTGLGLSVVYTLLKQNNVNLEVTSAIGKGSEFTLGFPVAGEQVAGNDD